MSKLRFEKERKKKPIKNIGYYVAFGLCLAAVGVAGWTTLSKNSVKTNDLNEDNLTVQSGYDTMDWDSVAQEVDAVLEDVPYDKASEAPTEAPTKAFEQNAEQTALIPEPKEATEPATAPPESAPPAGEPDLYTLPVSGEIHKSFSGEDLVYSQTLEDWRVHEGVDITASKGDKVKTAAKGEVLEVYEDDLLGFTVVIRHSEGVTAYYSGLSEKVLVEAGKTIDAGTILGTIDVVPCELVDPPHLHFAVKKDGKWVDPIAALGLKI